MNELRIHPQDVRIGDVVRRVDWVTPVPTPPLHLRLPVTEVKPKRHAIVTLIGAIGGFNVGREDWVTVERGEASVAPRPEDARTGKLIPNGEAAVILRRFDSLKAAIDVVTAVGSHNRMAVEHLEFSYDQARSAVERLLGTRGRHYDPPPNPGLPTGRQRRRGTPKGD
jgi:hypothetical protein